MIRVPSKRERQAAVHNAERCEEPEQCVKCLRYANRVMHDGAQGLLDEIERLRARLNEMEGFSQRLRAHFVPQVTFLVARVKELEAELDEVQPPNL
jgi:hypothetical protein